MYSPPLVFLLDLRRIIMFSLVLLLYLRRIIVYILLLLFYFYIEGDSWYVFSSSCFTFRFKENYSIYSPPLVLLLDLRRIVV